MKRRFAILGLLSILSIAWFLEFNHTTPARLPVSSAASKSRLSSSANTTSSSNERPKSNTDHTPPGEWDEGMRKLYAMEKEMAASFTPRLKHAMVEGLLYDRKGIYDALFKSWGLEASVIEKVMAAIRTRETQSLENRIESSRKGLLGSKDLKSDQSLNHYLSDSDLLKLINPQQLAELTSMEKKLDAALIASGLESARRNTSPKP